VGLKIDVRKIMAVKTVYL